MHLFDVYNKCKSLTRNMHCRNTVQDTGGLLCFLYMTFFGSMSVSEQLCTHPSPDPTLTLTCYESKGRYTNAQILTEICFFFIKRELLLSVICRRTSRKAKFHLMSIIHASLWWLRKLHVLF